MFALKIFGILAFTLSLSFSFPLATATVGLPATKETLSYSDNYYVMRYRRFLAAPTSNQEDHSTNSPEYVAELSLNQKNFGDLGAYQLM